MAQSNSNSNPVHWFGSLKLAYKYVIVFLVCLFLTFIAGFIKVMFNRRKLLKAKKAEAERGPTDDMVELNLREKDEGDLFGVRAIEAGFFAGVAQSRPVSRANSVKEKIDSPFFKPQSTNNSVRSLGMDDSASQKRISPPSIKLQPSEAELNGRRNHNGANDLSLSVHPSPSPHNPRSAPYATYGESDSDISPHSADFNPQYYTPTSTIAMPDALRVSYYAGDDVKSQSASLSVSPTATPAPLSVGGPRSNKPPIFPSYGVRSGSRSPSPESFGPPARVYQPSR